MASRRIDNQDDIPKRPPATTPTGREKQLVGLAVDLAERQLREGNASSQVITHYLKLGSSREMLEQDKIAKENELLEAKKEAMVSAARIEELMEEAINAFRGYRPSEDNVVRGEIEEYDD